MKILYTLAGIVAILTIIIVMSVFVIASI